MVPAFPSTIHKVPGPGLHVDAPSCRRTAAPAGRRAAPDALERDPAPALADAGQRTATRAVAGAARCAGARYGRAAALLQAPPDRSGCRNAGPEEAVQPIRASVNACRRQEVVKHSAGQEAAGLQLRPGRPRAARARQG